jgi:hypothetical protein
MDTSILRNTRKILGIGIDDTSFDLDVILHINSAFSILTQIGVGFSEGFSIDDEVPSWEDFIFGFPEFTPYLGLIKTCVYLRVRLAFDPPQIGYLLKALEEQIAEHEKRLSLAREAVQWFDPVDPVDPVLIEGPTSRILDGGDAG